VKEIAAELNKFRDSMMSQSGQGLTATYNKVHDPNDNETSITRLRELHVQLDLAVREAYGWSDLELEHGFHDVRRQGIRFTISPGGSNEVLERLLELNKVRFEAEQGSAGGATSTARVSSNRADKAAWNGSLSLFDIDME